MVHDFAKVAGKKVRIVKDDSLTGSHTGRMYAGGTEVFVSPAMYALLETDFDAMIKTLQVEILPPRPKQKAK